jgi:hypothetical protein
MRRCEWSSRQTRGCPTRWWSGQEEGCDCVFPGAWILFYYIYIYIYIYNWSYCHWHICSLWASIPRQLWRYPNRLSKPWEHAQFSTRAGGVCPSSNRSCMYNFVCFIDTPCAENRPISHDYLPSHSETMASRNSGSCGGHRCRGWREALGCDTLVKVTILKIVTIFLTWEILVWKYG